jgi:hypothetical protein
MRTKAPTIEDCALLLGKKYQAAAKGQSLPFVIRTSLVSGKSIGTLCEEWYQGVFTGGRCSDWDDGRVLTTAGRSDDQTWLDACPGICQPSIWAYGPVSRLCSIGYTAQGIRLVTSSHDCTGGYLTKSRRGVLLIRSTIVAASRGEASRMSIPRKSRIAENRSFSGVYVGLGMMRSRYSAGADFDSHRDDDQKIHTHHMKAATEVRLSKPFLDNSAIRRCLDPGFAV